MKKQLAFLNSREDRDTFFQRVHVFALPYHEGALLVAKAYEEAKKAFKGVQRKRGERYFEHCRAVALILMDVVGIRNPAVIAAALLHDIVEDCAEEWPIKRVYAEFGPEVGALVLAMTMPTEEFASRELRLEAYHAQLLAGPADVLYIKFADRLHNLTTCEALSQENQLRMVEETESIYLPLAKAKGALWQELTQVLRLRRKALKNVSTK